MLSLLSDAHFWTLRDDISIPSSDFGAFRYYDKKTHDDSISFESKKSYAEKRGHTWVPSNKRPVRLKENLKELEDHLTQQRIVLCQWRDSSLLQLMFSSGLFVNISVNVFTGDPISITFDKYLVGKLLSDYVADVILTKSHIICSYNESHLTLVYFTKPTLKRSYPKSFSRLDPRIHTVELAGPSGRRLERKLVCNVSGDMVLVWWHSSHDEVYPWSPVVKDQDRANVLVYGISGIKADLLCHHRSEFDLLSISFSQIHSNVVRTIEQKVSRSGDVTVESSSYQISKGCMQRTSAVSITLPTHVCCHSFSPLQDKLLLGCIDGSLVLFDEALGVTQTVKAAFIPSIVSWHPDGGIFIVANERCQSQILDVALATLKQQLLSEDVAAGNLFDITSYFRSQPTLRFMKWNGKAETNFYGERFSLSDCLLLLFFERGPFAALRFVGGGGLRGDIHGSGGFTVDSLVAQYLWTNLVDRAINLLLTMNWDVSGSTCLSCLQRIVNHLFKLPLTSSHEVQIQTALGCFHMPIRPMCPATIDEFKAPVRDLTRRFFHQLLRHRLYEKAFRLAIDLMDHDLFMDIHFSAKRFGQTEVAKAAYKKAEELDNGSYVSSSSDSSHSKCSRTSCSECSDSTSLVSDSDNIKTAIEEQPHLTIAKHDGVNGKNNMLYGSLSFQEHRSSSLLSRPPLPVISTTVSPNCESTNTKRSDSGLITIDKSMIQPPIWNSSSVVSLSKGTVDPYSPLLKDSLDFSNEKGSTPSQFLRSPGVHSERPKVKFCDTVTQITLPDRLHTLPEEEEDLQSSLRNSSTSFSSHKSPQQELMNKYQQSAGSQSPLTSFTLSANSVGIPIVTSTLSRNAFPERKNSGSASPGMSSLYLSRIPSVVSIPSSTSHCMPLKECSEKTVMSKRVHSGPSSYSSGCPKPSAGKVGVDSHIEINIEDSLDTEELSALLPGSRKPLGTNLLGRSVHSSSVANGPEISTSLDSSYFINYNSAVHDLSEEEENNGSIKIVHFGVV